MAGHSKWANIKHRKAAADAKKGKVFTRLIKEITVASKLGGADPDSNPRLRLAMDKAREANMTKDSVQNAVKRGAGQFVFAPGTSEDKVMETGLEAGAEDVLKHEDASIELICAPADFQSVKAALEQAGLKPEIAEITMKPTTENALPGDEGTRLQRL